MWLSLISLLFVYAPFSFIAEVVNNKYNFIYEQIDLVLNE
jgi:hypothetical protein